MKRIHVQAPASSPRYRILAVKGLAHRESLHQAPPILFPCASETAWWETPTTRRLLNTLLGGSFVFPDGAILALCGSDFGATLDNCPVDPWSSFEYSWRDASTWAYALGSPELLVCTRRHYCEAVPG